MIGDGGLLALIKRTIGAFGDFVAVPFVSGVTTIMGFLQTLYYHVHGATFTYPDYADPITLTAGAGAWNQTGTIVEIIPANTIIKAFDLHWVDVVNISGNGTIKIDFFAGAPGAEVKISGTKITRTAVFSQEGAKRIQIPQQSPNTRISARISDSTAGQLTCDLVSFDGHVYSASLT